MKENRAQFLFPYISLSLLVAPSGIIGIKMHLGLTNAIERNKSELASWEWVASNGSQGHSWSVSSLGPAYPDQSGAHTHIYTHTGRQTTSSGGQTLAGHGAYVFVKLLNIMAMECHSDAPNTRQRGVV